MTRLVTHNSITISGQVYSMKPTFAAISEIERTTGKGFFQLIRQFQCGEFLFIDMICIIYCGIKHGENNYCPNKSEIGEAVIESGIDAVMKPVTDFLRLAITGSIDD